MDSIIDGALGCVLAVAALALLALGFFGALSAWDSLHYERQAFAAITACEAKRMEPHRKWLSSEVVCIPAYRATKNDTLNVTGLSKP